MIVVEIDWEAGKVSGTVYSGGRELTQILTKVCLIIKSAGYNYFAYGTACVIGDISDSRLFTL